MNDREFELAERYYWLAVERSEAWLDCQQTYAGTGFEPKLAAWLRDAQLGPVPHGQIAMIVLRATQAALFNVGVWLCWNRSRLGAHPERSLPGDLAHGTALTRLADTQAAAATALSLHLNQGPYYFDAWRCADVEPDDSLLYPPRSSPPAPVAYLDYGDYHAAVRRTSNVLEEPYHHPVLIPRSAWPIIAAHLAYRRLQGASDDDLLFTHPHGKRVYHRLRSAIVSSLTLLNQHQPPWMHSDECRHGADAGLLPRAQGWLIERGLSVHRPGHRPATPERPL